MSWPSFLLGVMTGVTLGVLFVMMAQLGSRADKRDRR